MKDREIIEYLESKGIKNILRSIELIKKSIDFNKLDFKGLTIFTEAASGEYIYTPIIAAMAGAEKVYAKTNDSKYASKEEVKRDTFLLAKLCKVENKVEIVFDKEKINEADVITNLGFVRPIDKNTIDMMKKDAVISYMCESWEVREEDVDINYCKKKDIHIMGTNEEYLGLDVFNFSGPLCLKMLFDSGLEIYKNKIVILSNDKFGKVIFEQLTKITDDVNLINDINNQNKKIIRNADVLIIADYTEKKYFIGKTKAYISAKELKDLSRFITVLQFAGNVDLEDLKENNIKYYPEYKVGSFRMGKTLAHIGPKPVIDLHCAGLKVGEIMYRNYNDAKNNKLCQLII